MTVPDTDRFSLCINPRSPSMGRIYVHSASGRIATAWTRAWNGPLMATLGERYHDVIREALNVEWIAGVGYCGPDWERAEMLRMSASPDAER